MKTLEQVLQDVSHVEAMAVWQALSQYVSTADDSEDAPHDAWLQPAQELLERLDAAVASQAADDELVEEGVYSDDARRYGEDD